MKLQFKILAFILLNCIAEISNGECSNEYLAFYPQSKTVKQNSFIVIEGYAWSQKIIDSLNCTLPIYLQSDKEIVNLRVDKKLVGMFEVTQAILIPERALTPGQKYFIKINNLHDQTLIQKWDDKLKDMANVHWKVEEGFDNINPNVKEVPYFIKNSMKYYGCGPEYFSHFGISYSDVSDLLIYTELRDVNSKYYFRYYLPMLEAQKIMIGHGMCGGAFRFEEHATYEARFKIYDFCGNTTDAFSEWIPLGNPMKGK
jgi:hypothetical protein